MDKGNENEELFSDNELEDVLGPQGELEDMSLETIPSKLTYAPIKEIMEDLKPTSEEEKAASLYNYLYRLNKKKREGTDHGVNR